MAGLGAVGVENRGLGWQTANSQQPCQHELFPQPLNQGPSQEEKREDPSSTLFTAEKNACGDLCPGGFPCQYDSSPQFPKPPD